MGSEEARELEARMKNLNKLETTRGADFRKIRGQIKRAGVSDYEMKKATIYKENYLKDLSKYSGYDNYELLMAKLKNLNPIEFYEVMSVNVTIKDLTYTSDQVFSQEEFNAFLNDLGIETTDIMTNASYDELRHSSSELKAVQQQLEKGESTKLRLREHLLNEEVKNSLGNIYNS